MLIPAFSLPGGGGPTTYTPTRRRTPRVFLTYIFLGSLEGGPTRGWGPVQYPGGPTCSSQLFENEKELTA